MEILHFYSQGLKANININTPSENKTAVFLKSVQMIPRDALQF